ncbi:MAG: zinc ribbon domain-containing protein [Candidatus Thermoplasmatota archaeon]|nr:zinc ribbon domain-containing protein [Candidatus Thermoplasmatota archaeon]
MDCSVCSEEIPDDSLFCPECGARQDPSKSAAMGGRNFGVVSGQAIQASRDMQSADAAGGSGAAFDPSSVGGSNVLSRIAGEMSDSPAAPPQQMDGDSQVYSQTDQIVNNIVDAERQEKEGARNEWLAMNQRTASGVLSSLTGGELPEHLASAGGGARFLDDAEDVSREKKRVKSGQPSLSLLRRMAEVAVRRVARKRGVAVESPQVAMTEDDTVRVNVTYVDDGRVLDTPPDLSNAFEHAISTEIALKGFDIGIEIVLFRSMDGNVSVVWGNVEVEEEEQEEDDGDLFACEDCGHYPIRESDSSCAGCGAQFIDDDYEEPAPSVAPSRGPGPGGPPRGGGPGGPPRGPSRGPGGPPSKGGPPSRGPGGPPSNPPPPSKGGPPSRGPGGPPSKGGPPSRGPGGPPSKGGPSGGPPSKGGPSGGPPSRGPGGPPKKGGPGGPPRKKGPGGPPRRGPPR